MRAPRGFRTTLVLAIWISVASAARAQEPSTDADASRVAAARDAFQDGVVAAKAQRWAEARDAFAKSYELHANDATLLNLAAAENELGHVLEAVTLYRRFLAKPRRSRTATDDEDDDVRADRARAALKLARARIAHIVVERRGQSANDDVVVIELDGKKLGDDDLARPIPVDPGEHEVIARVGDTRLSRAGTFVEPGETQALQLTLGSPDLRVAPPPTASGTADPVVVPEPRAPEHSDDDGEFYEQWWFWAVAGTVAVAGAVTIGAVAFSDERARTEGNVTPRARLP